MSEEKLIIYSDDFTVEEVRMIRAALRDLGLTTRMSPSELEGWRALAARFNSVKPDQGPGRKVRVQ